MVLEDSENYIVPPEEDEDQTDDQATDSDKPEDLEDLKHLGMNIWIDRLINEWVDGKMDDGTDLGMNIWVSGKEVLETFKIFINLNYLYIILRYNLCQPKS